MKKITEKEILLFFENLPIVRGIVRWSKANSFPGFMGVPIYDVTVFLYNEVKRFTLTSRANSIAFSFFISLFPFIIVLFTLIAYLPLFENFKDILETEIKGVMPGNAGQMVFQAIQDITTIPRKGLMSLSFLLAIFFSSNGMISMMHGFEKSYKTTFKKRKAWRNRLVAIGLTILLGALLVFSVIFIILGNVLIHWLSSYIDLSNGTELIILAFRWIGLILLFYFGISLIYRYGPATHRRFSFFTPGAMLATILSILSSVAFSFYVDNFGTYNKLYGSIGTIIVVMLWIQINALVLLIGFELNASIAVNRDLKEVREE